MVNWDDVPRTTPVADLKALVEKAKANSISLQEPQGLKEWQEQLDRGVDRLMRQRAAKIEDLVRKTFGSPEACEAASKTHTFICWDRGADFAGGFLTWETVFIVPNEVAAAAQHDPDHLAQYPHVDVRTVAKPHAR
jgi:hypothetical protein